MLSDILKINDGYYVEGEICDKHFNMCLRKLIASNVKDLSISYRLHFLKISEISTMTF